MMDLIFDRDNRMFLVGECEANLEFIKSTIDWINVVINERGYVYLNGIYEVLGLHWDPSRENPCYRRGTKISIVHKDENKDGLLITLNID